MARSITGSNVIFTLTVPGVLLAPTQVKEFAVDDIYSADVVEPAEVMIGVDGVMSAGFIYTTTKQSITLQANSPSNDMFDAWVSAQRTLGDQYFAEGAMTYPSINRRWVMTGGALTAFPPMPDVGKVMKPRKFTITWENVFPVPM